jgi:hypothetical protein
VGRFLATAAKSRQEKHLAVGQGRDVRFEAEGPSGYALVGNRHVLHTVVFSDERLR